MHTYFATVLIAICSAQTNLPGFVMTSGKGCAGQNWEEISDITLQQCFDACSDLPDCKSFEYFLNHTYKETTVCQTSTTCTLDQAEAIEGYGPMYLYSLVQPIEVSLTKITVNGEPDDGLADYTEEIKLSIQCGSSGPVASYTELLFDEHGDSFSLSGRDYTVTCEVGDVLLFELNEIDVSSRNEGGAVALFYGVYAYLNQYSVNTLEVKIGTGDSVSSSVCFEADVSVLGDSKMNWEACTPALTQEEGAVYTIEATVKGSAPEADDSSLSSGSCTKRVTAKAIILNGDPYTSLYEDDVTLTLTCGGNSATSDTKSLGTCELCRTDTFEDISVECQGFEKVDVILDLNGEEFEDCVAPLCGTQTKLAFYPDSEGTGTEECLLENLGNPYVQHLAEVTDSDVCASSTVITVESQDTTVYTVILEHELLTEDSDCCSGSFLCVKVSGSHKDINIQKISLFFRFLIFILIVLVSI